MKTTGARGHARCADTECGEELIPDGVWRSLTPEERERRRERKQNRIGGRGLCQRCYHKDRYEAARDGSQWVTKATEEAPRLRNIIKPDAPMPAGWVRDPRTGVMRYEGDLDQDYAAELDAAGVTPDRTGEHAGNRDPELLARLYVEERLPISVIARKVAAREGTVSAILRAAGVTIRPSNQFGRQSEVAA